MSLEWLSAQDRDWVARNGYLLEAVWAHFEESGEWPDPVDILREVRAADPGRRVNAALAEMPGALAHREHAPPQLILSIFGLGCCKGARTLLSQYLDVSQFALRRFDSPGMPNRLTRSEVAAKLGLDRTAADRLSKVLMRDAPFLGSGESTIDGWDREVDPRAEEFEGIEDTDALLSFLSSQRRIASKRDQATGLIPAPSESPAEPTSPPRSTSAHQPEHNSDLRLELSFWAPVLAALATVASFAINLVRSPSAWSLLILGGFLGLTVGLFLRRHWRYVLLFAVMLGATAGAVAGLLLIPSGSHGPYRYFVASTGSADVVVGLIEPHQGATMERETVLGLGDSLSVLCQLSEDDEEWAKLPNGSFVPARLLSVEVGGDVAPTC